MRTVGPRPAPLAEATPWLVALGCAAVWFALETRLPVAVVVPAVLGAAGALFVVAHLRRARHGALGRAVPMRRNDGLLLGSVWGKPVFASWEDTLLTFMAPRSGKTTAQSVPFTLAAPGPVVATSNKADLWAATQRLRAVAGQVWLFDPQRITYQPRRWYWDPLDGLSTVEDAHRLAGHFVVTIDDGKNRDLWGPAAQDLLSALFLAAAADGQTLNAVARWLDQPAVPEAVTILRERGFPLTASSLLGTQQGAVETRDGIYQTARTATKALRDQATLDWVTPPLDAPETDGEPPARPFDPAAFAGSRDTLYLLSKSRSAAAPLVAALTDAVVRAAERAAERNGGRLAPPLLVVLDEAANICRIGDLPDLYSHLGSRGIVPVTILQSYEQGVTVWGEAGMAALWSAATVKIVGSGIDSPRLARDLSVLVGREDVAVRSLSYDRGRVTSQVSVRRQDVLEPADVRALPPRCALLLATGARPALLRLRPWFEGPDARDIAGCALEATEMITQAARAAEEEET